MLYTVVSTLACMINMTSITLLCIMKPLVWQRVGLNVHLKKEKAIRISVPSGVARYWSSMQELPLAVLR